ncbi:MAG: hypothetical protein U0401_12985 [Anaerolineae bacterium]
MCGIVGVYNRNNEPVPAVLLTQMTDIIAHRGPDSQGAITWMDRLAWGIAATYY